MKFERYEDYKVLYYDSKGNLSIIERSKISKDAIKLGLICWCSSNYYKTLQEVRSINGIDIQCELEQWNLIFNVNLNKSLREVYINEIRKIC
jgi:hypothetical protein